VSDEQTNLRLVVLIIRFTIAAKTSTGGNQLAMWLVGFGSMRADTEAGIRTSTASA